jgi:hypothetical protein
VTLAGLAGALALASPASAADEVGVAQTAWFWQRLAPSVVSPEPSNVPAGDLAVAADASGAATKQSYVQLDLSTIPARATLDALAVTLSVDPAATNVTAAPPALTACPVTGVWSSGVEGDWAARPAHDCTTSSPGVYDATAQTYRFDLMALAPTWLAATNRGFAIVPGASTPGAPFQVSLLGQPAVSVDYTVPAAPAPTAPVVRPAAPAAAPVVPAPVPQPAPYAPAPALSGVTSDDALPAESSPAPRRPVVAAPARRSVRAGVSIPLAAEGAPSAAFLLALLAGGAALAGTAVLVAEDSLTPATAIARRRAARVATL